MFRTASISRRSFLTALGLGTAAALLAGCSSPASSSASSEIPHPAPHRLSPF